MNADDAPFTFDFFLPSPLSDRRNLLEEEEEEEEEEVEDDRFRPDLRPPPGVEPPRGWKWYSLSFKASSFVKRSDGNGFSLPSGS
jgi:hypothetical protein